MKNASMNFVVSYAKILIFVNFIIFIATNLPIVEKVHNFLCLLFFV
jgi:hypothetical protein